MTGVTGVVNGRRTELAVRGGIDGSVVRVIDLIVRRKRDISGSASRAVYGVE